MNPGFERVGTGFLFTHTARALARTYYLKKSKYEAYGGPMRLSKTSLTPHPLPTHLLEFVAFIRRFVGQFLAFLLGRTLSTITRAFTPDIFGIMIKVAA